VPDSTFGRVLRPMLDLGLVLEAEEMHRRGWAKVRDRTRYLHSIAPHFEYLAFTRQHDEGLNRFQRCLRTVLQLGSPFQKLRVFLGFRAALDGLERNARSGGRRPERKLRLPETFPLHRREGAYDLGELLDWFDGRVDELAAAFDARNGNRSCANRVARQRERLAGLYPPN
jgi:hypothetical protein